MAKNVSDDIETEELSGRSTLVLALLSIVCGVGAIVVGVGFSAIWYEWGALAAIAVLLLGYLGVRLVASRR